MVRIPKPKRARKPNARVRRKRLAAKALKMWADWIKRDGRCLFVGRTVGSKQHVCKGVLQAMHCFGKKAYPAAKYEKWNGIPGCGAAHTYYTWQPVEWTHWLMNYWGEEL